MRDFAYYNPIHVSFGRGALAKLGDLYPDQRVLLIYGGASAKATGAYDRVASRLRSVRAEVVDCGGVRQCTPDELERGVGLARANKVDVVVGLGGGSVMDLAKGVAYGALHDGWPATFLDGSTDTADGRLPLTLVPTYPSTGSEANAGGDIVGPYRGIHGVWADWALLDPELTFSLGQQNTAYSVLITFVQASTLYLGDGNPISHGFAGIVLRKLLAAYARLLGDPSDYDARATVMWASFVTTQGMLGLGTDGSWTSTAYTAGMFGRLLCGLTYRQAQVIAYPRWLLLAARHYPREMRELFCEVMGLDQSLADGALA